MAGQIVRVGWVIAALVAGTGASSPVLLRDQNWLTDDSDRVIALTTAPAECISASQDTAQVRIGRAAFQDPLLLGGQAARAGMSCDSCHTNGRRNADFHFPGLSGDPGTADVTSSLVSRIRGDHRFNPRPIPDLAADPALLTFARQGDAARLEAFIAGLVTEEFDGQRPPPPVLAGLVAYVEAMSADQCGAPIQQQQLLRVRLQTVSQALAAAQLLWAQGDVDAALAMVRAARSQLGLIAERFRSNGFRSNPLRPYPLRPDRLDRARAALHQTDQLLINISNMMRKAPVNMSAINWASIDQQIARLSARLEADAPRSLFDRATLRKALDATASVPHNGIEQTHN